MAVFQGTRTRSVALGARSLPASRPVTAADVPVGSRPRVRPAAIVVVVILAAALLGFAYLTQTLVSAATSVEIERLADDSAELQRRLTSLQALVRSEAAVGHVRAQAQLLGLTEVSKTITLPAH